MIYAKILGASGTRPVWWRWPNFSPREISCNCCGEIWQGDGKEPPEWLAVSMDRIQALRAKLGRPLVLTCGHRCAEHNREVGGVADSRHLRIAFDCVCPKAEQPEFCKAAQEVGFKFVLPYADRGFVHLDMRI